MDFSVTVLGTASAVPNSKRNPSSQVVNYNSNLFLVDCGEGTQIRLRQNHLKLSKINHIFISHLHGDHVLGLFGLLSTYSLLGRVNTLHIYSDVRLKELIDFHNRFFKTNLSYKLVFHGLEEGKSGIIYQDKNLYIQAFPLKHSVSTHGFLFREKKRLRKIDKYQIEKYKIPVSEIVNIKEGADFILENGQGIANSKLTFKAAKERSFAYCSDTAHYPSIVKNIENVDLLFHESTFCNEDKERAQFTMHSTAEQAASIAKEANVKKLLLGHFSTRYKDLNPLLEEAKLVFSNTIIAEEGQIYKIEEQM